jgi:hypothetical protein
MLLSVIGGEDPRVWALLREAEFAARKHSDTPRWCPDRCYERTFARRVAALVGPGLAGMPAGSCTPRRPCHLCRSPRPAGSVRTQQARHPSRPWPRSFVPRVLTPAYPDAGADASRRSTAAYRVGGSSLTSGT